MNIGNGVRINNYQRPVNLTEIAERGNPKTGSVGPADTSFKQMFSQELTEKLGVSFSKHASERL